MSKNKGFYKHESSDAHSEASSRIAAQSQHADVGSLISSSYATKSSENRNILKKIFASVIFLARQSLPMRGTWSKLAEEEINSNFHQLLLLRSEDDPSLKNWMAKSNEKYTSPEIQNEILQIIALGMLRNIAKKLQAAKFFTIMADESADISNKEQLVVCIRWVDDDLTAHEEFIGLHPLKDTSSKAIFDVLSDAILRLGIKISDGRGQCYDGASAMSGAKNGVAKKFKEQNPKMLYTHCYGHALNLAVKDTCTKVRSMKDCFDIAREITKLIKDSPKKETLLKEIREESANSHKGIHTFCPTRWTVRGETLASLINNHKELMELWEKTLETSLNTEMKARVLGAQSAMRKFNFLFCCILGKKVLSSTDNLSRALQSPKISAVDGQNLATQVVRILEEERSDIAFENMWSITLETQRNLDIDDPKESRRKVSGKQLTVKDAYRAIYFEVYDFVVTGIRERFNQNDFLVYKDMQSLLLKAANKACYEEEFNRVSQIYSDDIDCYLLSVQLKLLAVATEDAGYKEGQVDLMKVMHILRNFVSKEAISQVLILAKLLLVAPATNATSERTFSTLRRIKTYLRSTMSNNRLNHNMVIHIHGQDDKEIDINAGMKEFIQKNDRRKYIFGMR